MDKNKFSLKIHCLWQPLPYPEWSSIIGDKYCHALPFEIILTDKLDDAAIVVWDGIIPLKMERLFPEVEDQLKKGKILILTGESPTLFKNHPDIRLYQPSEVAVIEIPGWPVLPEEILAALETCYQKIVNV